MSQSYYCYVRDSHGDCLEDVFTDSRLCLINSLDFESLINRGYSIEIIDFVSQYETTSSYRSRCRRLSRRTTDYILSYNKLPNKKRL